MVSRRASRDSIVSLAGWLLADIFLVLGIVWLGSQPFVETVSGNDQSAKSHKPISRALNTKPTRLYLAVDAGGIRSGKPAAVGKLHADFNRAGVLRMEQMGRVAGLVLTFSGGDSCSNHGTSEMTSKAINGLLSRWYPTFVTIGTVKKSYVDFSCTRANKVKIEFYTFAN